MLLRRVTFAFVMLTGAMHAQAVCSDRSAKIAGPAKSDWNGWSPSAANNRFQSAAGLTVDQVQKLKLKWAFGFEGDSIVFAQPSVIGNNLFVGSASGKVHALDARTGCTHWTFQAESAVRPAIVMVPTGNQNALLVGDRAGWLYALKAETGDLLWKKKVDDHAGARVTGSPIVHEGVIYVPVASGEETLARRDAYACCTFRGSIVALRVADGSQIWKTYMIAEVPRKTGEAWGPSGAGVWSAPTLDARRGRLYAGTGNNYSEPATATSDAIVAVDLKTGKIAWTRQTRPGDILNGNCQAKDNCPGPDYDFGASPILEHLDGGRDLVLVGQKSGMVYALDPDKDGQIVWQARVGKGGVNGGVQWGMASDGRNLYAATSDVVRRGAAGYDPKQGGGLTALRIADGKQVWYTAPPACGDKMGCSPAQSAAVSVIPGVVFSGSLDGHVRAFSTEDGKVLWDFDTVRDFATVNGVKANGGGVDGPGAVVAGGMLFVGSGYQRTGGMGGNVLLAFTASE
ncbi:MAG TPA: PQQ-binding-like beta-propeller repeat protein [Bryobacteraceae bacterium]|jgi:polyvinyl alcohol dehydrogenase (cytochrome)